jgi:rfaE bifunctional protein nucleotidyltransferase chain/domain
MFENNVFIKDKVLTVEGAKKKAQELKGSGKRLVTVNGAFDILHGGHVFFLGEAKKQGDFLFVGINSDRSIKEGKGEDRPILSEKERVALVASLVYVDYVLIIDASYKEVQNVLLETVVPNVHVNGAEYGRPQDWIEWPVMEKLGVEGFGVSRQAGYSTTDVIGKILSKS